VHRCSLHPTPIHTPRFIDRLRIRPRARSHRCYRCHPRPPYRNSLFTPRGHAASRRRESSVARVCTTPGCAAAERQPSIYLSTTGCALAVLARWSLVWAHAHCQPRSMAAAEWSAPAALHSSAGGSTLGSQTPNLIVLLLAHVFRTV
jgi:hypothetical protein